MNTVFSVVPYTKPKINFHQIITNKSSSSKPKDEIVDYTDYNSARKFYDIKLKKDGKIFDTEEDFFKILQDKKSCQNLMFYLREHAEEELQNIQNKSSKNPEDVEYTEGLKEIISAFPSTHQYDGNSNKILAFKGKISKEDNKTCHQIIHTMSATCGLISGIAGEGAALGADTPFLWFAQFLMFQQLQDVLKTDDLSHLQYIGRQYVSGAYLGVRGAKYLCSWLGIGGHVASGGTASPAVTTAVRSVNAGLSTAITEKMGWGYVHACEHNMMNPKSQFKQNAFYAALLASGQFDFIKMKPIENLDISNPADIAEAIKGVHSKDYSTYGKIMHNICTHTNLPRNSVLFTATVVSGLLDKSPDDETKKKNTKALIGRALLNCTVYELFNNLEENFNEKEAQETIEQFNKKLNETPELWREFKKCEQDLVDKLEVDKLNSKEFFHRFKDNEFLYTVSIFSTESSKMLADKWREHGLGKLQKENKNVTENINNVIGTMNSFDKEDQKIFLQNLRQSYTNKNKSNIAMNRIAGYEGTKALLNLVLLDPIKKDSDIGLNSILFYGPSGTGKTTMCKALAEDSGSSLLSWECDDSYDNNVIQDDEMLDWIKSKKEKAVELHKNDKRYTFINIDEFGDLGSGNPETVNKFLDLMNNSAKDSHCVFLLTTNDPMMINPKILEKIDLKIPMRIADKNDIKEIVKCYSANKYDLKEEDVEKLTEQFESVKPNAAYSNSQIEQIFSKKNKHNDTFEKLSARIECTRPSIRQQALKKFQQEIQTLNGDV